MEVASVAKCTIYISICMYMLFGGKMAAAGSDAHAVTLTIEKTSVYKCLECLDCVHSG